MRVESFVESFSFFLQEKKSDFIPGNEEGSRSVFSFPTQDPGYMEDMKFRGPC
jgi:hypothetical protein